MTTAAFLATKTSDSIPAIWWVDINGIRRRYGTKTPSWASGYSDSGTTRVVKPYLVDVPKVSGQAIRPLNGDCESNRFSFQILDVDDELTDTLTASIAGTTTKLTATCDDNDTTLTVEDSTVFTTPCDLYIGDETVRATAAPTGTSLTVTRGMYGSIAKPHSITDDNGASVEIAVSTRPEMMVNRFVELYETRDGLIEADAIKIRGYIDDISEEDGVYTINCVSHIESMRAQIGVAAETTTLSLPLWGGVVWVVDTWDALYVTFHKEIFDATREYRHTNGYMVEHYGETYFMPTIGMGNGNQLIEGRSDTLLTTRFLAVKDATNFPSTGTVLVGNEIIRYKSKGTVSYLTGTVGEIHHALFLDDVTSINTKNWHSPCLQGRGVYSDLFGPGGVQYDVYGANDPTGSVPQCPGMREHPAGAEVKVIGTYEEFTTALGTNPIDITLQILLSTGSGYNNATYDVLSSNMGMGVDQSIVDVAGLEELRDKYFNQDTIQMMFVEKVQDGFEWLKENLWRPHLLVPYENEDGKLSLTRLLSNEEAEDESAFAIDDSILLSQPRIVAYNKPIGQLGIEYNYIPGADKYASKVNVYFQKTMKMYGLKAEKYNIRCASMYDDFANGNTWTATENDIARIPYPMLGYVSTLFSRFAQAPCPVIECEIPFNQYVSVLPGTVVSLTCDNLPNPTTGTRGFSAELCQVVGVKPNPEACSITVTMWMISIYTKKHHKIAPSAVVASYNATGGAGGRPRITLTANVFTAATDPVYTTDASAFTAGQKIFAATSGLARSSEVNRPTMEIYAVGTNYLDITAAPTYSPSAGDIIETEKYDNCISAQQSTYSFGADSSDKLGSGNDAPNVRL